MKTSEFHLLNRTYITPPGKNVSVAFGISEDTITPKKIKYIIDHIDECQMNDKNEYTLEITLAESLFNFEKKHFYMMTTNLLLFKTIPLEDDPTLIYDWLINCSGDRFLLTFPIYDNYIFDIHKMIFTKKVNEDLEFNKLIENDQFTIGDGLIIAFSLYSIGYWSTNNFKIALEKFLITKYNKLNLNIPKEWMNYYRQHYLHISNYPFFYAFQYVSYDIYSLMFNYKDEEYYYYVYYNDHNNRMYFGTLYTALIHPTLEHYQFIKNIGYTKFINLMNNYPKKLNTHYDIYNRLRTILTSRELLKDFLSKGITWRIFTNFIYLYKRLNILKIIQCLTYLYKDKDITKRSIKFIWRMIMKHYSDNFIHVMCGYLLEYIICKHNLNKSLNIELPPTKMIRDSIYMIQNKLSINKTYLITLSLKNTLSTYSIPDDLMCFKYTSEIHPHQHSFKIHYFDILKLLNYPICLSIEQRKVNILASIKQNNYELYICMSHYYKDHLDDLWKKNHKKQCETI